jgi:hypothetical protein
MVIGSWQFKAVPCRTMTEISDEGGLLEVSGAMAWVAKRWLLDRRKTADAGFFLTR